MARVYTGENVADFIFNESATYDNCADTTGVSDEELYEFGVIECVDEPEVACYRIALENEQNFNAIVTAMMNKEYQVLESTGYEMVYEAGTMKRFLEAIKTAIKKFWAKVTGMFKKLFQMISAYVSSNKAFVKKYKGKSMKMPKKEKIFKGYEFNLNTPNYTDSVVITDKDADKLIGLTVGEKTDKNNDDFSQEIEETKESIRSSLCGVGSSTVSEDDFTKELKIRFFGSEEKLDYVKIPEFSTLIKDIENADKVKKNAKEAHAKAQTAVKKMIAQVQTYETKINRAEANEDTRNTNSAVAKYLTTTYNYLIQCMSKTISMHVSAINAKCRQDRAMASWYVAGQNVKGWDESATTTDFDDLGVSII